MEVINKDRDEQGTHKSEGFLDEWSEWRVIRNYPCFVLTTKNVIYDKHLIVYFIVKLW